MPMDVEDQRWFEEKFGEVYATIAKTERRQTEALNQTIRQQESKVHQLDNKVDKHIAAGCKDAVEAHEEKHHNAARSVGVLAAIVSMAGTLAAGLVWGLKALWTFFVSQQASKGS